MTTRIFLILGFLSITNFNIAQNTDSLLQAVRNTKDHSKLARIYLDLSKKYQTINLDSANLFAIKMDYHAAKSNDKEILYHNHTALGNIYSDIGSMDKAIDNYIKALSLTEQKTPKDSAEKIQMLKRKLILTNNIGIGYFRNNDSEKAKQSFQNALEIINSLPASEQNDEMQKNKASIMNNISGIYMNENDFEVAQEYLFNALELTAPDNENVISIYNNLGICFFQRDNNLRAFHYLMLALENAEKLNNNVLLVSIFNNLANYYIKKGNFDLAQEYLEKSTSLESNINLPHSKNITLKYYADLYFAKGQYQKAFKQLLKFQTFKDSLISHESALKIAQIEKQYELEKAKQEYLLKQEQLKASQKRKILISSIIAIVGLATGLIVMLLFILQRTKLKKIKLEQSHVKLQNEKLAQDLDFRNKELATNVLYMVRKNELINNISEQLLRLKFDLKKANQPTLQQIIGELKLGMDNDIWKEFEIRFKEVHKDFYTKLNDEYPELTPNEKKLCAFLKLNMSSKEISAITFQTTESIRIARTRLRKKLRLTHSEQNLVEFLENL